MTKRAEIIATLAIVVVAIIVVAIRIERRPERDAPFVPTDPDAELVIDLPGADTLAMWYELGHRVGPEDPPIRIIEWGPTGQT